MLRGWTFRAAKERSRAVVPIRFWRPRPPGRPGSRLRLRWRRSAGRREASARCGHALVLLWLSSGTWSAVMAPTAYAAWAIPSSIASMLASVNT
ncbi:hypothetical protein HBB16_20825 [Pseudonocardia sp. MCCB 268]|nr:hypothetical protein [Pseudonocardia cytotoxica]